jgi:hypothetical protein
MLSGDRPLARLPFSGTNDDGEPRGVGAPANDGARKMRHDFRFDGRCDLGIIDIHIEAAKAGGEDAGVEFVVSDVPKPFCICAVLPVFA